MTNKQKTQIESQIGKQVNVFRHDKTNERWFTPWTPYFNIKGTITRIIWQYGDIPLYYVKFDEGFEGAFFVGHPNFKIL